MRHKAFLILLVVWFAWRTAVAANTVFDAWPRTAARAAEALTRPPGERIRDFLTDDEARMHAALAAHVPADAETLMDWPPGDTTGRQAYWRLRELSPPGRFRSVPDREGFRERSVEVSGSEMLGTVFVLEYRPEPGSGTAPFLATVMEEDTFRLSRLLLVDGNAGR